MKLFILIIASFLFFCTPALAAKWVKFFKAWEYQYYYDAESYSCYKSVDRKSGITTGYTATVWVKTSNQNNSSTDTMAMWSIDCSHRKIDKEGRDDPSIWGENIRPDSGEEKLYKIICPICTRQKYSH